MFSFGSRKKVAPPRYLLEENMLTIQQVEKSLPPTLKSAATQQLVDQINNIATDPLVAEQILSLIHI